MSRILWLAPILGGCFELDNPRLVMGNFDVSFVDNMRVFIGDELVAEVQPGSEETITWDGNTFTVSQVCGEEETVCPGEAWWRHVAVDQPWGPGYELLNFVNLDTEHGIAGQRMGGLMDEAGAFAMLSGLTFGATEACGAVGVGTVEGSISAASVDEGIVAYEWAGGCQVGEVSIGTSFRLESDFTAQRVGDYDISSVTPEAPIDAAGEEVDPEVPDDGSAFPE